MKAKIALFLVLCLVFASLPLGTVASEYIEYPYHANFLDVYTNCDYNPDDYPEGGEYDFNGVRITKMYKMYGENHYRIYLTSDWDAKDAVAVLEQSQNIASAELLIDYNAKKEPSTEPQYLTENLIDFEAYILEADMTSEAHQEYTDKGYRTSYGIEMPVEVILNQEEMDAYLTKFKQTNGGKLHAFAEQLPEDYFDTYALFAIYARSGVLNAHYYPLGVSATEKKTIIEYEYDYPKFTGLTAIQENVILIRVEKDDVLNFKNVVTYSTDLVEEVITYTLPGDVCRSGRIESNDYLWLKRYCNGTMMFSEAQLKLADVNGDGEVDKMDYVLVKRACFGTYVIE